MADTDIDDINNDSTLFFNCRRQDGRNSFSVRAGKFCEPDGEFDRKVDLQDAFVLPSFGDGHAHPLFAGRELSGPETTGLTDLGSILAVVRDFAEANPNFEWIVGGTYDRTIGVNGNFEAAWLDEAVSDRPVVLHARDHHTIWVNSEAMRRAGVNRETPDCTTGVIERFENGEPIGTFREWDAIDLILSKVPPRSMSEEMASLEAASIKMAASGVTWWQDAWIDRGMAEIYLATGKARRLSQDVDLAFRADPQTWQDDFKYFITMREEIKSSNLVNRLTSGTVKFFTDGIIESGTALLLESYEDHPESSGMAVWESAELFKAAAFADSVGFQLHLHAIGDGGVRVALDAIEYVLGVNPVKPRRPVIAHVQLIDERDIARFAKLGVIANFTPVWTCLDSKQDVLSTPRIGQSRSDQQYRMRSLLNSGARISFGSDWPVSTPEPLVGLPTAVHRRTDKGEPSDGWLMHEALTLDEALAAYTSGVAYQSFAEKEWGSLDPGMSANFVLVAQNPWTLPIDQISNMRIEWTYLRGEPIFERRKS